MGVTRPPFLLYNMISRPPPPRGYKYNPVNGKLEKLGFKNIRTHEIPFFITKRDENSFAKFHEINLVNAALKKGISENCG